MPTFTLPPFFTNATCALQWAISITHLLLFFFGLFTVPRFLALIRAQETHVVGYLDDLWCIKLDLLSLLANMQRTVPTWQSFGWILN